MSESGTRGRAATTRAALLAAAREAFCEAGYTAANIADIVERAGSSVGSLYHHFGGKQDLYAALYEEYQERQQHRAAKAFRDALAAGESDSLRLFIIATRAYLEGCWRERRLARLFLSSDGPPGFDLLTQRQFHHWLSTNAILLGEQERPLSDALVLVLTTIASTAGREVAVQPTRVKAHALIEEILEMMERLHR